MSDMLDIQGAQRGSGPETGQAPASERSRPRLLALVYAASLSLILVSAAALVWLAGELVTATAARSTLEADATIARDFAASQVSVDPATGETVLATGRGATTSLAAMTAAHGYRDAALLSPAGNVIAGSAAPIGSQPAATDLAAALAGQPRISIVDATGDESAAGPLIVEHLPIFMGDRLLAVLRIQRDASQLLADATAARAAISLVTAAGAAVLAILLLLIFRAAQVRLTLQARQLAEAARRDPLTGLLNHGAIVDRLSAQVEAARPTDRGVGIALIDIDNFGMLNETYGHAAGDFVLKLMAREIEVEGGEATVVGRYGPDEFLVLAPGDAARSLEATIKKLVHRLDETAITFGASENLPITISAGVAHFPWHAKSVSDLLSAATVALGEARLGGGAGTRTAGAWSEDARPDRGPFDVLTSLVIAVDTKDRYTKRHSEDVAAYALFLARQLDLDETLLEAIRTAGLLHDIGKIGTPDDILRKPGRLTAREMDIVKQHVALGDLIVRDLPASGLVRAGIRHHHERWDGTGYLAGLAGDAIPLIARVLAVADTFSAMTTTRPYRKALDVQEALHRVRDAGGTQLDARLAEVFAAAMETQADAPLPNSVPSRVTLWAPPRVAAA